MTDHIKGLSSHEAARRLRSEGPNELPRQPRRTALRIVLDVLREPMFALLLAGGGIYLALGSTDEAIILTMFATLSVSIAVAQDLRSERVLEALRGLASPRALVIRDGARQRIPGREVVRGDIVIITEGDRIAADALIREGSNLQADESVLTGESVPVGKSVATAAYDAEAKPGGDGLPIIYAGTLAVGGQGVAEVVATGIRTQIGKIGAALGAIQPERARTELEIRRLLRIWAALGIAASATAILLYGLLRGGWLDAFLAGIALGMSMLPEEFPLVFTVFMVMGAWRMSKARVLTRRASAIEALGAATILCTDKTGTLTRNKMQIAALATRESQVAISSDTSSLEAPFAEIVRRGVLASPRAAFDPMERAFHELAEATSRDQSTQAGTLVRGYPLRPGLMAMTQVWRSADGELEVATKGAIEAVTRLCRVDTLDEANIRERAEEMAKSGMRVLGVARARFAADTPLPEDHLELALEFVGLVGLSDPLREEVPDAIRECQSAGIRVVMVTGDYPTTAAAIARQGGLMVTRVLTGPEMDEMDDPALARALQEANVCARIAPLQKLRIVRAFKANGEVVAMTGDGVNDAPSLKAADIGIAMGGRGTDVARESAAIVLLDDDFASIVRTIRLGRRIYDNLRKAISYIMAIHIPIAGLALIPLAMGLPLLFFPVHIAFLEMIIDPVCSIAFEAEKEESDIMRRPPRPYEQRLFTRGMVLWSIAQGLAVLALVVGIYLTALRGGTPADQARALAFIALVAANAGLILVNRSFHRSVGSMRTRGNRLLWTVFALISATLTIVLLWPPARDLFQFGPLALRDLGLAASAGLLTLFALDAAKGLTPSGRARGRSA